MNSIAKKLGAALFVVWSITTSPVLAQQCGPQRVVLSINGVLTDGDSAADNMYALMYSWRGLTKTPFLKTTFDYMLNPSGKSVLSGAGGIADFIEAFAQRRGLQYSRILETLAGFDVLPAEANAELRDWVANIIRLYNPDPLTLQNMLLRVSGYMNGGATVVIVPHSQGNLFANSIASLPPLSTTRTAFGVVGVAVPDRAVENMKAPYVTLTEDLVIDGVRYLIDPLTLPATVSNSYPLTQWSSRFLSHSFTEAYLDIGKKSEQEVINSIDATFTKIQPIKSCIPPPFFTTIRYLPSFFGGLTLTNKNCVIKAGTPSTVKMTVDGSVSGTECYENLNIPKDSPYSFRQDTTGSFENTLSIFQANRLNDAALAIINARASATSTVAVGGRPFSSNRVSLQIDPLTRIKTALTFIARHKCEPHITGALLGSGYVEFDGSKVSLMQGDVTLGSAFLSELGSITYFSEGYGFSETRDQWNLSASRLAEQSSGLNQVNLTVAHRDSPNVFQVTLSGLKLSDGTSASGNCVATSP